MIDRRSFIKGCGGALIIGLLPHTSDQVLFGEKTLKTSSLCRLNFRRMLVNVDSLFHDVTIGSVNDDITRDSVLTALDSLLNMYNDRGFISNYEVQCDKHNNPYDFIDEGKIRLSILFQMKETGKYYAFDFVA